MQVFNAATQQLEDVTWTADKEGDLIATFEDGTFLKFPAGLSKEELQSQVDTVEEVNEGQEVITPEMEAKKAEDLANSEALVNELNGVDNVPEAPQE